MSAILQGSTSVVCYAMLAKVSNKTKCLVAVIVISIAVDAHAGQDDRDALALARVCVHEAGFNSPDDCGGIYEVLDRVRTRLGIRTIEHAADVYSPRATGRHAARTAMDTWVQQLNIAGTRPRSFPQSWERWQPRWIERLEQARRLVASTEPSACARPITHWGAPYGEDLARALRAGWQRVDCGHTRNYFWSTGSEPDAD